MRLLPLFAASAALLAVVVLAQGNAQSVHMSQVTALTFAKDKLTTGRRTHPMPQLQCVKGNACRDFTPSVVQCTRTGWDGYEAQWECKAELPAGMSLGETTVNCEGYSNPDDEYILRGSCGLEYELRWTTARPANWRNDQQGQHFDNDYNRQNQHHQQHDRHTQYTPSSSSHSWSFSNMIIWALIIYIGYQILKACMRGSPATTQHYNPQPPRNDHRGWFGGGGGGNGGNGPHPGNNGDGGGWFKTATQAAQQAQQQQQGGRRGFWSGAGLGGLAGYALGRGFGRQQQAPPAAHTYQPPTAPPYSSGYAAPQTNQYYTAPAAAAPAPVQADATHKSTGYGGTKRR